MSGAIQSRVNAGELSSPLSSRLAQSQGSALSARPFGRRRQSDRLTTTWRCDEVDGIVWFSSVRLCTLNYCKVPLCGLCPTLVLLCRRRASVSLICAPPRSPHPAQRHVPPMLGQLRKMYAHHWANFWRVLRSSKLYGPQRSRTPPGKAQNIAMPLSGSLLSIEF